MRTTGDPIARFFSNITVDSWGCWIWQSSITTTGYGSFYVLGKPCKAHRASWMLLVGELPQDLDVCHHCDTPLCVNPAHLFIGTHSDNMRDMIAKGRRAAVTAPAREAMLRRKRAMTMCKRGHELTIDKAGRKRCPTCAEVVRQNKKASTTCPLPSSS